MQTSSRRILEKLEKNGEMSLENLAKLLPKKHLNHIDFYPLASLIQQGHVEDSLFGGSHSNQDLKEKISKLQYIAWELYALHDADKSASYRDQTWNLIGNGRFKDQLYTLTAKGYLQLEELRRNESSQRIVVLVSILSALLAVLLTQIFK